MNKNGYIRSFSSLLVLIFLIYTAPIRAQGYLDAKITSEEQAVFAFFRAAGTAPDYEKWIKSSPSYKALNGSHQEDYLVKEMLRLGRGYGLYDQDTDVLELEAPIIVKYHPAKNDTEQSHLAFRFSSVKREEVPVFDYPFGDDLVALTIRNLNVFSNLPLTPEHDRAVRSKIPSEDDEFDATLTIHTQVYDANYKQPAGKIGSKNRWLMIGKVAYLECRVNSFYAHKKHKLWDYVAPWYEEQFRIKNMPEEKKYPHPYDLYK